MVGYPGDHAGLPKIEHPESQGEQKGYCITLPQAHLTAERRGSRRDSTASARTFQSRSSRLSSLDASENFFESTNEIPHAQFFFNNEANCIRFQSLIMGPNIVLQAQFAIEKISSNHGKESFLQYVRLWQKDRRQYLTYFPNDLRKEMQKDKEFDMMMFRGEVVNKLDFKLKFLSQDAPELTPAAGLTRPIHRSDIRDLKYLLIRFESQNDCRAFIDAAHFNGVTDRLVLSELNIGPDIRQAMTHPEVSDQRVAYGHSEIPS